MSDGQLQLRIRAYERETAWAPRYVANELAGTRQAADRHRQTAATRAAEAADTTDAEQRVQLEEEAADAAALAGLLDNRVTELETVDEARALWWAHTAGTRAAADRAAAELQARRAADGRNDQEVTADEILADATSPTSADDTNTRGNVRDHAAEATRRDSSATRGESEAHDFARREDARDDQARAAEPTGASPRDRVGDRTARPLAATASAQADRWDEARHAADAAEDPHREIRDEADLDDVQQQRAADRQAVERLPHPDAAETNIEDVRDTAAREPQRGGEDHVRVPTSGETADSIRRAQRALAEIRARDAADHKREADQARSAQLNRWHQDDRQAHAREAGHDNALTRG